MGHQCWGKALRIQTFLKMFCAVDHFPRLLPRQLVSVFPGSRHSGKAATLGVMGKVNTTDRGAIKTLSQLTHFHKCGHFGESWVTEHGCVWSQPRPECPAFLEGSTHELTVPGHVLLFLLFSMPGSSEGLPPDKPQLGQGHPYAPSSGFPSNFPLRRLN